MTVGYTFSRQCIHIWCTCSLVSQMMQCVSTHLIRINNNNIRSIHCNPLLDISKNIIDIHAYNDYKQTKKQFINCPIFQFLIQPASC